MMSSIVLRNFKLLEECHLDLARLNILVGPNNSGKSSVLQAIALLKQSYLSNQQGLIFTGPYIDLEGFRDVIFRHLSDSEIQIAFGFRPSSEILATMTKLLATRRENLFFIVIARADSIRQEVRYDGAPILSVGGGAQQNQPYWLGNITPELYSNSPFNLARWSFSGSTQSTTYQTALRLQTDIQTRLMNTFFLGPTRGITQSRSPIESALSSEVGVRGEHLVSVLHYVQGDPDYEEQFLKVKFWAKEFGLSDLLVRLLQGPSSALTYEDEKANARINVANTGFGVNQLLPVIAQCFLAPKGSLIMIEEPEGHLHPAYQAQLLDFFADVVKYGNQVLLTTHSEHLILRLQRRLAEGMLKTEDIALYSLEREGMSAMPIIVAVDESGLFEKMPAGFFEEGFQEALKHVKAVSARSRKSDAK